jgi:hypothetical protein
MGTWVDGKKDTYILGYKICVMREDWMNIGHTICGGVEKLIDICHVFTT